jgi:hypothetical protein
MRVAVRGFADATEFRNGHDTIGGRPRHRYPVIVETILDIVPH